MQEELSQINKKKTLSIWKDTSTSNKKNAN